MCLFLSFAGGSVPSHEISQLKIIGKHFIRWVWFRFASFFFLAKKKSENKMLIISIDARVFRSKFSIQFFAIWLLIEIERWLMVTHIENGYVNWTKCWLLKHVIDFHTERERERRKSNRISCHRRVGHQSMCWIVVQTLNGLHSFFHYNSTSWSISFIWSPKRTTNRNETELRIFISKINKTDIDQPSIPTFCPKICIRICFESSNRKKKKKKNRNRMR